MKLPIHRNIMRRGQATLKIRRPMTAWAVVLASFSPILAQSPPTLDWEGYFSDQSDFGYDFVQKENGNLLVAATATNWNTVEPRILLFEVDPTGKEIWRTYVGEPNSKIRQIVGEDDGGYLLFGYITTSSGSGQIAKTDSSGALQWVKSVPGISRPGLALVVRSSREIVFATSSGADAGSPSTSVPGLFYLSENGDSLRSTRYEEELAFSIGALAESPINGGIVLAGFKATLQDRRGHVLKVDANGDREWSITFGTGYIEHLNDIIEDPEGNFVVTGVGHTEAGGGDLFAAKISTDGELVWDLYAGSIGRDGGRALIVDGDGKYVIVGETTVSGTDGSRMYLVKVNTTGQIEWEIVSDVPSSAGNAIQLDEEGGYVIVGWAQGLIDPTDAFVIKYRPTAVTGRESVPEKFSHAVQVFPNPASQYFVLHRETNGPGLKRVELFDILGRSVLNGIDWINGSPSLRIDLGDLRLPSGVYFVRVSAEGGQTTLPIMLVPK